MRIDRATAGDATAVEALLRGAGLPLEGAAEALSRGVVARDRGAIVAAAAVERYGDAGLLRSVVVAPERRGSGIGARLLAASETLASELGIDKLYLLTDTAEEWFASLGYERTEREHVPARVRSSIEFTTACSDTAVAMKRRLGS